MDSGNKSNILNQKSPEGEKIQSNENPLPEVEKTDSVDYQERMQEFSFLEAIKQNVDNDSYEMIENYIKFCLFSDRAKFEKTEFLRRISKALEQNWNFDLALLGYILIKDQKFESFFSSQFSKKAFKIKPHNSQQEPFCSNEYFSLTRTNQIPSPFLDTVILLEIDKTYYLQCEKSVLYMFSFKRCKQNKIPKLLKDNDCISSSNLKEFLDLFDKKLTERQGLHVVFDEKEKKYISVEFSCKIAKTWSFSTKLIFLQYQNQFFALNNDIKKVSRHSYLKMDAFYLDEKSLKALEVDKKQLFDENFSESEANFNQNSSFYVNIDHSDKFGELKLHRKSEKEDKKVKYSSMMTDHEIDLIEDRFPKYLSLIKENEDRAFKENEGDLLEDRIPNHLTGLTENE